MDTFWLTIAICMLRTSSAWSAIRSWPLGCPIIICPRCFPQAFVLSSGNSNCRQIRTSAEQISIGWFCDSMYISLHATLNRDVSNQWTWYVARFNDIEAKLVLITKRERTGASLPNLYSLPAFCLSKIILMTLMVRLSRHQSDVVWLPKPFRHGHVYR